VSRAVLRTAHEATVLTHTSSIVERLVPVWGISLETVHTTRQKSVAGRRTRDWVPHRGVICDDDTEVVDGVRVSTAARAAVEVTTIAGVEPSLVVVNGLLRANAMTLVEFASAVDRCRSWPGSLTSDLVLRLADPRLESVGEDRFSFLAYRQGLPRPEPQFEVCDPDGVLVARVDFAWPDHKVFVEFDGKAKYELHRLPGETLDEFLMREKAREEQICQLTGWTCIRITWDQLARPEILANRIRRLLFARAIVGVRR
jgi:hypothetical protein